MAKKEDSSKETKEDRAPNNGAEGPEERIEIDDSGSQDGAEDLKAEAEKYKKEYLYLRAEFDNYKKNMLKERSDLIKFGSERLVLEVLNVLDIFERALESEVTPENLQSFVEGMKLTANELKSALQKFGVEEMTCENQAFDPVKHEALSSEETNSVEPGHISQVFKKGYTMHKKVIRPSQVVVAKEPSA